MKAARRHRSSGRIVITLAWLGLLLAGGRPAHSAVAVMVEEPYGAFSHLSPSGHVAVYLDHVCTDTPTHLRPCRPGELGTVISRYHGIGHRDWIAIPLLGYLYAVGDARDIPVTVAHADATRLREAYRLHYLLSVVPTKEDGEAPEGNWYELAGAAFDRSIYGFQVKTTAAQDAELITRLNERANQDVFNGLFRNCADFVRVTVNHFYPGAIHRNYVADLGFSSPKAMARGLAHYAAKHPEVDFQAFQIAQISGELPRSHPAVTLTEGVVKEFGVPLAVFAPVTTGVIIAAYLYKGRFPEPETAPVLNLRTDVVLPDSFVLEPVAAIRVAVKSTGVATGMPEATAAALKGQPQSVPAVWTAGTGARP